ncbi:acyltransferase [Aeromonas encheleia]|uniref:Acyltransferase n=1 Tax=Aeromonas encheleia TaxID=73010 RepID=A0AAE9MJR8_9GAMM|nr:acyltransferase [Aeromonas encheleia]USV58833.1 acyltransferase [Aeromonas encheleia]
MNKILRKLKAYFFYKLAVRTLGGYKSKPTVNFYSRFTSNTYLGKNCHFNGLIVRGKGRVLIGDNFHSGKDVLIINSYHQYDGGDAIPYDSKNTIDKDVIIDDNAWIGDRVIILGGVTIGEGAIVQAGSVVVNDIQKFSIVGGAPASHFKYRDIESYEALKERGLFT